MVLKVSDFPAGTTKGFTVTIKKDDVVQDIRLDTVTVRFKKKKTDDDASAVLSKTADVSTGGLLGDAIFSLVPSDTKDLATREYFMDVEWVLTGGAEYIVLDQKITILERVSDVPA